MLVENHVCEDECSSFKSAYANSGMRLMNNLARPSSSSDKEQAAVNLFVHLIILIYQLFQGYSRFNSLKDWVAVQHHGLHSQAEMQITCNHLGLFRFWLHYPL